MNKTGFRFFGAVLLVTLLALTLSACGGGDSSSNNGAPVPKGWQKLSEGPYTGIIRDGWSPFFLDPEQTANLAEEGLSGDAAEMLSNLSEQDQQLVLQALGNADSNTLLVFMESGETTFSSNINVLGCFGASDVPEPGKEVETMQTYGVQASKQSDVSFMGQTYPMFKIKFYSELDTYQVYPSNGDCHVVITLTVPAGDTSALNDFTDFLKAMAIDYSAMQAQ